jgi:hypothetical protein
MTLEPVAARGGLEEDDLPEPVAARGYMNGRGPQARRDCGRDEDRRSEGSGRLSSGKPEQRLFPENRNKGYSRKTGRKTGRRPEEV